jgi:hypothetical protein
LVGPLKRAPGGYTHLLVTIDKFSKWIEVRPITTIRSKEAIKFSLTSSTISEYQIPSLPTMAQNSWAEGYYIIVEVLRLGTYKLKDVNGRIYNNAWNIEQLCRFYP